MLLNKPHKHCGKNGSIEDTLNRDIPGMGGGGGALTPPGGSGGGGGPLTPPGGRGGGGGPPLAEQMSKTEIAAMRLGSLVTNHNWVS